MSIEESLEVMKNIQTGILDFLENEEKPQSFQNLKDIINKNEIRENKHKLKAFLRLIINISNNHHRDRSFFNKIERILRIFSAEIKKYFTNLEIFNIFKSNKRLLLFFINNQKIIIDNHILKIITSPKYVKMNYPEYLIPELKPFINDEFIKKYEENEKNESNKKWIQKVSEKVDSMYRDQRNLGENENFVIKLIRNDMASEFIAYSNQINLNLNSEVIHSIFETNPLFLKNPNVKLIEYAAFYGSLQIIRYLMMNKVELTPSLWIYAIHSNNPELIHFLEEYKVKPTEQIYQQCYHESIKCHHNEFAYYIQATYLNDKNDDLSTCINSLKYYNYSFIQNEKVSLSLFCYYLCKYDYYLLVEIILEKKGLNVNIQVTDKIFDFQIFIQFQKKFSMKFEVHFFNCIQKDNFFL